MKILLLGDSNTAGVYNAMTGVYPGGAVAPAGWTFTPEWWLGAPLEYLRDKSAGRIAAGERYDVVVVSGHIGNAIGEYNGTLYNGVPVLKANALPCALDIRDQWECLGSLVFLTGGHGISPTAPVGDPLWDSLQAFYHDYYESLRQSGHELICSYRQPRHDQSNWPAATTDYVHASPSGYVKMANRLRRQIELAF